MPYRIHHTQDTFLCIVLNGLTYSSQAQSLQSQLLIPGALDGAFYLCYFNPFHRLAVINFIQADASLLGYHFRAPQLQQCVKSSLDHIMRVG